MESKVYKFAAKDVISVMPDNVATHILDRLPLQDAVRTGILSRNWRFKWTMLSQLVFDTKFFFYLLKTKSENNYGRIISKLLLHLKGPITKFVLYIDSRSQLDDEDIAHWILLLSGKGVKDLTLQNNNWNGQILKLPTYLFSCLELKHLELHTCCFNPPASFHGFPNLLSLGLWCVRYESGNFCDFLTSRPVLEILKISYSFSNNKVQLAEIAKLGNLKMLYLSLYDLEKSMITISTSIFELVGSLSKLEELHLDFQWCKSFTKDGATRRSPTTFSCLKTLKLSNIASGNGFMLSFAFEIIRSSPNLHTLQIITTGVGDDVPAPAICFPEADDTTMGLLRLQSVVCRWFEASENEVCLIKYLLACSPFLKKVLIRPRLRLTPGEKLMFTKKLLKFHRASPLAEINFL